MKNYIKDFSIIHRSGILLVESRNEELHITGQVAPYLFLIQERPGISQEDISRELRINKGAVARAIKKMVENGMVYREANPEDMRQYRIYPTEKLLEIHEACEEKRIKLEALMTEDICEEDLAVFERVLMKMRDNVIDAVEARTGSEE